MRPIRSLLLATVVLASTAAPAMAAPFPEHVQPPACDVVTALPVDIIGHLATRPAAATQILADLLSDACLGAP